MQQWLLPCEWLGGNSSEWKGVWSVISGGEVSLVYWVVISPRWKLAILVILRFHFIVGSAHCIDLTELGKVRTACETNTVDLQLICCILRVAMGYLRFPLKWHVENQLTVSCYANISYSIQIGVIAVPVCLYKLKPCMKAVLDSGGSDIVASLIKRMALNRSVLSLFLDFRRVISFATVVELTLAILLLLLLTVLEKIGVFDRKWFFTICMRFACAAAVYSCLIVRCMFNSTVLFHTSRNRLTLWRIPNMASISL